MTSFNYKNNSNTNTTAQTLTQGNAGADDSGLIDATSSLIVGTGAAVTLALTTAPAAGGIVINNAGTLRSNNGRTIDTGSSAATGTKISITNSGTIFNAGGASANDDAIRVNTDIVSGTFLLYNTGSITTAGNVNDSVAVRLGKVYSASSVVINNGIDANGNITTGATISTADADAIRPGGVGATSATVFGSSTINNYGTISASYQTGATAGATLAKDNGIDIGAGQAATVNNFGTIVGDESGLGSDNAAGTVLFAPTYFVTNNFGATITGNNGPGISIGSNTSAAAPSTTSTITNFGTITGKATGVGRTLNGGATPTVSAANGTGIFSAYAVTIINGSTTNATATIQGSGVKGSPTVAQQGGSTYEAINAANGSITNYGSIVETTATGAGAAILFTGSTASTITNYGTITGANGLAITMGTGNDTVNLFTGEVITGTIDGGAGTDTLNLGLRTGIASGTLSGVANFEALNVNGGSWTITDAESYSSGITIASGANLTIGPNGSTSAAIADNGTLTYTETETFTKAEAITGTGKVIQAGTGTLVLSNGANTYSGSTTLTSGTLDITTQGAAGTGAITFGTGTQTLDIEQAALKSDGSFANTLSGLGAEDVVDLRGIGTATGASYDAVANVLTLTGGSQTASLHFDGSGVPAAGYAYGVSADGNSASPGTLVALDRIATVQSVTTSPSSGYAKAGDTVTVTITTSKAVSILGGAPVLNLSGGGTATFVGIDSTGTILTFSDTVANGQDATGIKITSIANAASVQDAAHVAADFSGAVNQTPIGPVIDTTPPQVSIMSAAGLTNQATQLVSGSGENGTTVRVYESAAGSNTPTFLGSTTVSGGSWSASVNLSGNGHHTIFAQDTDAAGNIGTSGSVSYDLETTAPPVSISSVGGLTNQATQTVVGSVDINTDPEAIGTTVTVSDTTTGQVVGTAQVGTDGSFSATVTLVGDGGHTLQASDTDKAQNTGFATITYTLDTVAPTPPTVTLTNDTGISGTDKITSNPSIAYTPSASGDTLLYSTDGITYSTSAPTFATDGSQDGAHTVYVEEKDAAGNIGSPASLTFTLDTMAPTAAPTIALANDTGSSSTDKLTNDPTIRATAATSGDTLLYAVDGSTTYTTTVPTFATDRSQDGSHTVSVKEEDAAGNIGPAATLTFTLDTTPPAAPSISLANDTGSSSTDKITNAPTINYRPSASGDTLLYKADGAATYTSTVPTFLTDGSADGQHTVSVEEKDAAGNISAAASLTFTLDTTPPDVDFTSPGGTVNTATQIVNGTVGVEDAGTTVSIFQDGSTTASATAVVKANGHWSASVTLNGNGAHSLTASDTDKAGNTGSTDESLAFNLDTTVPTFTPGNLVISISGNGDGSGDYGDNQATPLVLQQITTDGTFVSQIVLPQTTTTVNGVTESVISAEYGSSSEGSLQLSADGHSLVIAGYGVNADTYNAGGAAVYGNAALAQSTSIQGGPYIAVPRVIADINANGTIDTSTSLYNVYNGNNPRSVATIDGSTFYISGQGIKGDTTQGLFLVQDGASTETAIDTSTDTRTATIYNGQLFVSRDSKQGTGGTSNIAVYGATLPTGAKSGTILQGISKSVVITAATENTINAGAIGTSVNLDPENFFFANANTLYVADGGIPKQGGIGDGGLQKWTFNGTQWTLQYTLSQGLNIISGTADEGTTGLIGLTGKVVGDTVQLYATNQTIGDTDQKYVFGINDSLSATTNAGQSFTTLVTAAPDTNIRGIAFAPTPITPTIALLHDTGVSAADNITSDSTLTYTKAITGDTLLYAVGGGAYSTTAPTFNTDGTYTVSVEEKDKGGNIGPASSLTFTLDTTADAGGDLAVSFDPTNSSVAGEVNAANASATSFSVTGLDVDASATVTFSGTGTNGSAKSVIATVNANGAGTVDLSGFQDGTITATITATDTAGNHAAGSGATTVLDTTADVGSNLSVTFATSNGAVPGDINAGSAGAASFSVSGLDSDATAIVTFSGTGTNGSPATVTAAISANGSGTVDLSGLRDGTVTASVTATDAAGNRATESGATAVLDTTADVGGDLAVSFGSNAAIAGDVNAANAHQASFTVAGLDADATALVTFAGTAIGGGATTVTATASTNGAGAVDLSGFQDGTITASIAARDTAGNSANGAGATTILDATAPSTLAAPILTTASDSGRSSTDGVTNVTTPTVTGSAEAGSTVTLYDGTRILGTGVATNGTYSINSALLSAGSHTLTVKATDAAGNASAASASLSITIDTTAPAAPSAPALVAQSDSGTSSSDGITNVVTPTLTGTAEAGSTVTLFDGTSVVGVAVATGGTYSVTSSALSSGSHSLSVTATDLAGNVSTSSSSRSILIDTTPPASPPVPTLAAASDSGASQSDGITKIATPTITGTAEAGSIVTLFDGSVVVGTAIAGSTGAYSISSSSLTDGPHTLTATATDAAGNVSQASGGLALVIDTTAPAAPSSPTLAAGSDSGVSSTDGITNVTTPTVTGSAEVGSTVTLFDGATKVGSAVATNGTYSITASTLAAGSHTLTVTATDVAGNTGAPSAGRTITIDTTPPTAPAAPVLSAASDSGVSSTDGVTNVTNPTFTGTAEANATVTLFDGSTAVRTAVAGSNGAYSVTASTLTSGSHTLSVTATDAAGNTSGLSAGRTVLIDTTAPSAPGTPTLTAASDSGSSQTDGITKITTPTVTGSAEAGSTVTLLDGTTKVGSAVASSTGAYSITSSALANGSHTLTATATDVAGNVSQASGGLALVIDTTPPAAPSSPTLAAGSDSGVSSTDGITNVTTPTVTGSAEVGSTVTLFDGTTKVGSAVATNGTYSITASALASGSHTLTVTATDVAGNTGAASAGRTITIDTTAPTAPAAPVLAAASDSGSSSTDGVTNVTNPTLTGTAEANATVTLFDGSTAVGTAVAGSNGAYSVTASTLTSGSHTMSVTATDAAGNTSGSSAGRTVLIDTTPPSAPAAPTLTAASDSGSSQTDGITKITTPTVTGSAEAGSTVTLLDGTTKVGSAIASSTGAYSITSSALANGSHTLTVTATDTAGNVSLASGGRTVVIDTTAPAAPAAPTLTSPSTNGVSPSAVPTFAGIAEAGSIVTLFDGATNVGSAVASSSGAYTVRSSTLADGSHTFTVVAMDAAGNISATSATLTVVIDATPPATPAAPNLSAASDTGASSTDGITSNATPTVSGRAQAGSTVTLFDGTAVVGTAVASPRGVYVITSSALSDGSHALTVTATDSVGNVSGISPQRTILVDTTAPATPAAPILSAESDTGASSTDGITNASVLVVTGTAEAASTVTLLDGTDTVGSAVVSATGSYTITSSTLAEGPHTLTVTATDTAGNISAASAGLNVVIETSPPPAPAAPVLVIAADSGSSQTDGLTNVTTPTVSGTALAGSTITLFAGGRVIGTALAATDGTYTITSTTALLEGAHALRVTQTDIAGNTSAASRAQLIVIDTTAPATPAAPSLAAGSDSGSSATDRLTNVTTPTVTGRTEAGATVTLFDGANAVGSATANASGVYAVTSSALSDGTHALSVTATDAAGNVSAASRTRTIVIDTTPPATPAAPVLTAASDTGAFSTDGVTNNRTPTFTGTVEAGSTVTLFDGASVLGTAVADTDGSYSVTATRLTRGPHNITVAATDAAGNVSQVSPGTVVVIDFTAPAIPAAPILAAASDSGSSQADGITNVTTPVFTGLAEAGSTITLFNGRRVVGTAVATNGTYSVTSSALTDGAHNMTVTATDVAGNVSSASAIDSVIIDTVAPDVTIATKAATVTSATQTISGKGEAGTTVTITDTTTSGTTVVGSAVVGRKGNWSSSITLSSGNNSVTATDVDSAGNVGTSATVAFNLTDANTANSLNSLVQAMSTMTPSSSASISPTATATPGTEHQLAAAH